MAKNESIWMKEYLELKAFLEFFILHHLTMSNTLTDANHPSNVFKDMNEKKITKRAFDGLKQAVNDCVEMTRNLKQEEINAIDSKFKAAGVLTLTTVRGRYSRELKKILRRGSIKSDDEYFLVRGLLSQSIVENNSEYEALDLMLNVYEGNIKK